MDPIDFPATPTDYTTVVWVDAAGKNWLFDATKNRWGPVVSPVATTQASRRHHYVPETSTSYCGRAPVGALDSESVWEVRKIVISPAGISTTTAASGIAWLDHLTATYS